MSERIRELFAAVKNDPSDFASIQALDESLRDDSDWPGLLDLYLFLADHAADPTESEGGRATFW